MHMKEKIANLSELKKMLLLCALVSIVLIAGSSVGLFFNQPGWIIGVSLGCIVEAISIVLLYKGSSQILKAEKPALFLLFYTLRMFLFVAVFLVLVLLDTQAQIEAFKYSFWGELIGYTPMQAIVVIVSLRHRGQEGKVSNNE